MGMKLLDGALATGRSTAFVRWARSGKIARTLVLKVTIAGSATVKIEGTAPEDLPATLIKDLAMYKLDGSAAVLTLTSSDLVRVDATGIDVYANCTVWASGAVSVEVMTEAIA